MLSTLFKGFKKTNFDAGFLRLEDIPLSSKEIQPVPNEFLAPRKIDSRDMCLSSSNQEHTPHCAGYATAGYIEYYNWKTLHYPKQVDGDLIYDKAKELDPFKGEGTTFTYSVSAAFNLNLISGTKKYINKSRNDVKFALHQYGVCLGGFLITDEWNFVSTKTGQIINKGAGAQTLGGHAILLTGYCDNGVYIQNSWGESWGVYGFAILSWDQFDKQFMNGMVIM